MFFKNCFIVSKLLASDWWIPVARDLAEAVS